MISIKTLYTATAIVILTSAVASAQQIDSIEPEPAPFAIGKVTIAITNVDAMVEFYSNVFDVKFSTFDVGELQLYSGRIAGLNVLLCPNELAGVEAQQNRTQFDYVVSDLNRIKERALEHGGTIKEGQGDVSAGFITVIDPDNNTIVFIHQK